MKYISIVRVNKSPISYKMSIPDDYDNVSDEADNEASKVVGLYMPEDMYYEKFLAKKQLMQKDIDDFLALNQQFKAANKKR